MPRTAIIIGAGPAGLTAAYELLTRSDIRPIVLERSEAIGGLSQTVQYHGNRMDIGGHRFFSKSDRVMEWWLAQMPLELGASGSIAYHRQSRPLADRPARVPVDPSSGSATPAVEVCMLLRPRQSRIYFLRQLFDYPIRLNARTLRQLGPRRMLRIAFSYARASLFPPPPIVSLEDFLISRFGRALYDTFFKSYTEKVWGVPCTEISAAWGAQRIKGLSIRTALAHGLRQLRPQRTSVEQRGTETSLIERFLYPPLGPGQLWERVAERVRSLGGTILTGVAVDAMESQDNRVVAVSSQGRRFCGDYFFSTMPIRDLLRGWRPTAPTAIRALAEGLQYRDFITVGLLLRRLALGPIADNWIYIQESEVRAGRLQIFNNWSSALVRDPNTVWIGVEYFCYDTEPIWRLSDREMSALAVRELETIGILRAADVLDSTVVRVPKAYPAYFGPAYARFDELRAYLDGFENLYPIGRNGMHKYNNQDHSMLTAMTAVDNIVAGIRDKSKLWAVNTEPEYHEGKHGNARSATAG